MGARGPAPTPTPILKLRGSRRADDRAGEPQPERGIPTVPRSLNAEQKKIWRRLCTELDSTGVLTRIDHWELERYCVFLDRWRRCEAFLAKNGDTYILRSGTPKQYVAEIKAPGEDAEGNEIDGEYLVGFKAYPQVKLSIELHKSLKDVEDRFGLTPAARARIRGTKEDPANQPRGVIARKRA